MTERVTTRRRYLTACGAAAASLAGCMARGEDRHGIDGRIVMDGSNTVLPHGAAVGEEFVWRNNRVRLSVRGSGTGAGFQRFCADETDVQNASRGILGADAHGGVDERAICETAGVEYLEVEALQDGLAVWAHPDNDWCTDLTVDELTRIWESGSDVETWADVRSEWPDREIELYGRDSGSGTFDYFTRALTGEIGNIRSDYSASADTNVIVRGVRGNRDALGWGGAGYYYENQDDLKLLGVDDGDGPVYPTRESIESGEYRPLTRSMYVYFNVDAFEREAVAGLARFYFQELDDTGYRDAEERGVREGDETLTWTQYAARRVGFFAAPDEVVAESRAAIAEHAPEVFE